jgi:hypothetical protein
MENPTDLNPNSISFSPDPPQLGKQLTVTYTGGTPGQRVGIYTCHGGGIGSGPECDATNTQVYTVGPNGVATGTFIVPDDGSNIVVVNTVPAGYANPALARKVFPAFNRYVRDRRLCYLYLGITSVVVGLIIVFQQVYRLLRKH